ncbi:MAG: hypothetical protein KAT70_08330, partial [Thermoplasmata archaeon]|nr:hypothetical protein [Thermoplasmata archaeon]
LPVRKSHVKHCTSCGKDICPSCGEYPHVHRDSGVFFEYEFQFPLCKDCYLKAFRIQEEMGRASAYFGTGNMTYASRHASIALKLASSWSGGEEYVGKAERLDAAVERTRANMQRRRTGKKGKRSDGEDRSSVKIEGDKWTRRFVERALSRKGK